MRGRRFLGGEPGESGRNGDKNFAGKTQGLRGFTERGFKLVARVAELDAEGIEQGGRVAQGGKVFVERDGKTSSASKSWVFGGMTPFAAKNAFKAFSAACWQW